ncbi:MAG: hypothetical protein BWY15_00503 [Firmicutes bacterium ADurb.Bin193]|nr:MAG: hypothetical protein BWY15_00503 [Firmicutes bacterium ADurb.Bin193]
MDIVYKKQPEKYLKKTDKNTYNKLIKAIEGLTELEGDIIKLQGSDLYRLKIYHYRIIFAYNSNDNIITIEEINSRGDVYK